MREATAKRFEEQLEVAKWQFEAAREAESKRYRDQLSAAARKLVATQQALTAERAVKVSGTKKLIDDTEKAARTLMSGFGNIALKAVHKRLCQVQAALTRASEGAQTVFEAIATGGEATDLNQLLADRVDALVRAWLWGEVAPMVRETEDLQDYLVRVVRMVLVCVANPAWAPYQTGALKFVSISFGQRVITVFGSQKLDSDEDEPPAGLATPSRELKCTQIPTEARIAIHHNMLVRSPVESDASWTTRVREKVAECVSALVVNLCRIVVVESAQGIPAACKDTFKASNQLVEHALKSVSRLKEDIAKAHFDIGPFAVEHGPKESEVD